MNQSARSFTHGVRRTVLAALALMALGTTAAMANPIQATWDYQIYGQFDPNQTTFLVNPGCHSATTTALSWGGKGCNSTSSLTLAPTGGGTASLAPINGQDYSFASGTVHTDWAAIDSGITLTHNNFVISLPAQVLDTTHYLVNFYLTNPDAGINPISLDFTIKFVETENQTNDCASLGGGSSNECPDIFAVSGNSVNQLFTYDSNDYFLSLFPLGPKGSFNTLPDEACEAAGVSDGCVGFITKENAKNAMTFGLSITSKPIGVPEPGILGMMGLGLLGIGLGGYALRRRKLSVTH